MTPTAQGSLMIPDFVGRQEHEASSAKTEGVVRRFARLKSRPATFQDQPNS